MNRRNGKRPVLAGVLCFFLLLALLSPAALAADRYWDVWSDDWFNDAVDYVSDAGLMSGVGSGCFAPEGEVTRAMIVTVIYRMEGSPAVYGPCPFADVAAGSWYEKAVTWAAAAGVVSGYSETVFAPADPISREQLAAVFYRYAGYCGFDVSDAADISGFADADEVAPQGPRPPPSSCASS